MDMQHHIFPEDHPRRTHGRDPVTAGLRIGEIVRGDLDAVGQLARTVEAAQISISGAVTCALFAQLPHRLQRPPQASLADTVAEVASTLVGKIALAQRLDRSVIADERDDIGEVGDRDVPVIDWIVDDPLLHRHRTAPAPEHPDLLGVDVFMSSRACSGSMFSLNCGAVVRSPAGAPMLMNDATLLGTQAHALVAGVPQCGSPQTGASGRRAKSRALAGTACTVAARAACR